MTPNDAAAEFEAAASELELAVAHYRTVASHFRQRDIPRACAHVCAAQGHIHAAHQRYETWLVNHANRSTP